MFRTGVILVIIGASLGIFGFFIGIEAGVLGRIMHLPSGLAGGTLFLAGIILIGFGGRQVSALENASGRGENNSLDDPKWQALVQYDRDLAQAASTARSLGKKYERELAKAFLALGERSHIPAILQSLQTQYEAEQRLIDDVDLVPYVDTVFEVDGEIRAGLLTDRRAVGLIDGDFRIFDNMTSYRSNRKDADKMYTARDDLDSKRLFARSVAGLIDEILPRNRTPRH